MTSSVIYRRYLIDCSRLERRTYQASFTRSEGRIPRTIINQLHASVYRLYHVLGVAIKLSKWICSSRGRVFSHCTVVLLTFFAARSLAARHLDNPGLHQSHASDVVRMSPIRSTTTEPTDFSTLDRPYRPILRFPLPHYSHFMHLLSLIHI